MARRWAADQMWLFVPVQDKVKQFMATIPQYPFQEGVTFGVGNINYQSLAVRKAMMGLQQLKQQQAE
ncbi:hypothetical protein D3C76_1167100 [compost metagenome]